VVAVEDLVMAVAVELEDLEKEDVTLLLLILLHH
jgi:hypothetical protein